jgi:hypothetical protein
MITSLYPKSQWVEISLAAPTPYVASSNNSMQGAVRCMNNRYEVWDGSNWQLTGGSVTVDLSSQAKLVMDWAHNKMLEERMVKNLAQTNSTIADALSAIEQAEEKLKVLLALTQENT